MTFWFTLFVGPCLTFLAEEDQHLLYHVQDEVLFPWLTAGHLGLYVGCHNPHMLIKVFVEQIIHGMERNLHDRQYSVERRDVLLLGNMDEYRAGLGGAGVHEPGRRHTAE